MLYEDFHSQKNLNLRSSNVFFHIVLLTNIIQHVILEIRRTQFHVFDARFGSTAVHL